MIRPAAAVLALAAIQLPFGLHAPAWVERTLYNPRERTAQGLLAWEEGRYDDAVDRLEAARRLDPAEPPAPLVGFNEATARLAAGKAGDAAKELAEVAGRAERDLAVASRYNLGNARMEAGELPLAIEAYKEALRRAPGHADAKHNLELALARLEKSKKPELKPPQESPGGGRQGEQESGSGGGGEGSEEQRDQDEQGSGDRDRQPPPQGQPDRPGRPDQTPPEPRSDRLPRFEDQPDMSADQAAALLEAVENLERRQRQQAAAERARRPSAGRKDW
jgi:Ca-activated chloride channel family protein